MVARRYITYTDIPATSIDYITSVTGIKDIHQLSLTEINAFLNDMEHWYGQHNPCIQGFSKSANAIHRLAATFGRTKANIL